MINGTPAWTDRCFTSITVSSTGLRGVTRAANSLAVSEAIRLQSSLRALALTSSGLGTWFPSSLLSRLYRAMLSLMPSSFGWRDFSDSWTACDQHMYYINETYLPKIFFLGLNILIQHCQWSLSFCFFLRLEMKRKMQMNAVCVTQLHFLKAPITFEWKQADD